MSEKRFVCIDVDYGDDWYITDNGKRLSEMEIVELLNEQQEEIAYWKHRVNSLLWILSQFDNEKVKKLLEELDE